MMTKLMLGAAISLAFVFSAANVSAQESKSGPLLHDALGAPEHLVISGSVRARYEALGGQARAGFGPKDELFSLRTIVSAEYRNDDFRVGAELYDSRAYGSKAGSAIGTGEVNTFEFVQAYVGKEWTGPFGPASKLAVQLGRFTFNLGSRRLIAADDYRNTTNGYTGVRADAHLGDGSAATLFYTLPQVRLPDDMGSILDNRNGLDKESFDLQLWGGLVSKSRVLGKTMAEVAYVRLQERDKPLRPTRDRNLHTVGGRLFREPAAGTFDHEFEGYYQFGSISNSAAATAPMLDVSAWFLHAEAGYSFPGQLKARVSLEYDYASGDGPGRNYGRFDTLFGTRRSDFGPSGIYAHIGRANISTPGVRFEVAPTARLDGFMVYRAMWLAGRRDAFSTTGVRDASGNSGSWTPRRTVGF